jgi:S-adenosylmethionine synthetase
MISVEELKGVSVAGQSVEVVERKGKGHPDFICDAVMEAISVELSKNYIKECGTVLHHNIDKGLLAAGRAEKSFGGGRVLKPMELILGDRATFGFGDRKIPVHEIAIETAKRWFKKHLRFVDPEKDVRYRSVIAEGSDELKDIFSRAGKTLGANDTSAAVGYYPLSPTERIVLEFERYLNSPKFKERFPETGEDVKIMGLRQGKLLHLTVAMPLLSRFVTSEGDYCPRKKEIYNRMMAFLQDCGVLSFDDVTVHYNTLDKKKRGLGGVHLSLLGTSAEDADSGQVGRGNRVNGLISMNRPMGTEAAAGKNPVSHVGKIYNVLAHRMAKEICENVEGIKETYVLLLNRIGSPIDQPMMASAQLLLDHGKRIRDAAKEVEGIIERELHAIYTICSELIQGRHPVC